METTATFDSASDEFVIHTPSALGQKYWITNSAVHAHVSAAVPLQQQYRTAAVSLCSVVVQCRSGGSTFWGWSSK